ncbi:transcription elongation factor SPT6-like [Aphidius gifuensis]|uniref:transcription elongation factor SPT6-like n=1 Tax=Aphidius gifuensis TaxID=684658 RepID=UPI001CDD2694|nr:transcription elongation factor SPT6-like [Aphidius gifuensis]
MKGRATNIGGVDEKSDDDNVFEDSEEENNNDIINPNKRNRSDDDEDDYCLEDDDYDLLEENLGVKIQRKKYKRLRTIQADDSDGDDRDAIANQLFNNDDDDDLPSKPRKQQQQQQLQQTEQFNSDKSEDEDSDYDNFIDDDDDGRQLRPQETDPLIHNDALREARDIFGVDFDFGENESLEVPYIAYYKKDYVLPELDQNDLWRVYKFDAKWSQLCQRKNSLLKLYSNMYEYQQVQVKINSKYSLFDNIRMINVSDLNRLKNVETNEELNDIHQHFSLYYNYDIPAMQELIKRRKVKEKYLDKLRNQQVPNNVDENNMEIDIDIEVEESNNNHLKQRAHSGPYSLYRKAGLDSFAKKFEINEPSVIANNYFKNTTSSTDEIINAVKHMVAIQLSREPLLRKCVRKIYMEHAKITVKPTKTGIKMIDESHPIFTMMYLKDKPINTLIDDQFLNDTIEGYTSDNYVDDVKKLYVNNDDELDDCIENWNNLRQASVEMALNDIVIPSLKNELKSVLIDEAKEHVMRACCKKLYDWIKIAPYKCDNSIFDGDDWDTSCGLRVMTISYVPDQTQAGFACIVTPNGDCTDYLKLPHVLKLEANHIFEDIKKCVTSLMQSNDDFPDVPIEIYDNHLSKLYSNSTIGKMEFNNYNEILREAISLARYIQDPLREFSRPRKSTNIIKILKNSNKYLENRPQLMTLCQCDEIVYKNYNFIEILDSSRIHPDDYDFARRMALDILEYDDENATKALEEILDKPNILEDLDLDTYAEQIVDESGEKRLTLEDIRTELHGFFKDLRVPYEKPDSQQLFELLTKETQDTFYVERRDEIHPVRNNDTRLWKCSYCNKDDFIELSHVWNHLDNEECTGKLTGIKIKFDNGITGYIKIKNMSDDNTTDIPDNIQINTPIKSQTENIMKHHSTKQGDAVIRPSSKGCDHLTITWKVTDNVFHHIDIREEDKPNSFSVGRRLFIGEQEFDDLYEIMTNYVKPLAENAATIINYKYYKSSVLGSQVKADNILKKQQIINPKYIPYILSVFERIPTYFMLSYLPHNKVYHEYIQITSNGFIYREKEFKNFQKLLRWFKEYYNKQTNLSHELRGLSAVTGYSGTNKYIDDLFTTVDETPTIKNNQNNKAAKHSLFDPDFW